MATEIKVKAPAKPVKTTPLSSVKSSHVKPPTPPSSSSSSSTPLARASSSSSSASSASIPSEASTNPPPEPSTNPASESTSNPADLPTNPSPETPANPPPEPSANPPPEPSTNPPPEPSANPPPEPSTNPPPVSPANPPEEPTANPPEAPANPSPESPTNPPDHPSNPPPESPSNPPGEPTSNLSEPPSDSTSETPSAPQEPQPSSDPPSDPTSTPPDPSSSPGSPNPPPPSSSPPPPTSENRRKALTCSLCLDIYRTPKLLPCSHSFCLPCLENLLTHYLTPAFPCPNCRRVIAVPKEGGVSAFQTNFYIHPEDLVKARNMTHCLTHAGQDLDMFCVDCEVAVCLKCKLTRHQQHQTQELSDAFRAAREQLKKDKERLDVCVFSMIEQVETARKDQQTQLDKRSAMESIIRKQHGTLVAGAEKFLVEALATLKTASDQVETDLHNNVEAKQADVDTLCQLQDDLEKVLNSDNKYKLMTTVKEMKEGRGSPHALSKFLPPDGGNQPRYGSDFQPDFILNHFREFLTTVSAVEAELNACSDINIESGVFRVKHIRVTVSVEKQFRCGDSSDAEVFSLCPLDDGSVWISYVTNGSKTPPPSEKYDSNGKLLCSQQKLCGKISFKGIGNGKVRHLVPLAAGTRAYCKTGSKVHFRLSNSVNGKATITKVKVIMEEPFNAQLAEEFSINVGPHRAFDVDGLEELIVVLEEAQPPETQRKVRMYKRKGEDSVSTYVPPTPTTFQPTDVCFCRLGDKGAVLVADELGDSIHVLSLQEETGAMSFIRYLAPGSPSLLQPTALNTDTEGRLWVACRGGQLITMSPVT